MKKLLFTGLLMLMMTFIVSCGGTAPVKDDDTGKQEALFPAIKKSDMTPEEQQKEVSVMFNEILRLSISDRRGSRDKIVELYQTIMVNYPDAPLAEESYLRLIAMYLKEFQPPEKAKALYLHTLFEEKYPESQFRERVRRNVALFLHQSKEWEELISLLTPIVNEFVETGELQSPFLMYLYAEARFNLKEYEEAYKGYKIVIQRFPGSLEAKAAKKKVIEIEKRREEENR